MQVQGNESELPQYIFIVIYAIDDPETDKFAVHVPFNIPGKYSLKGP